MASAARFFISSKKLPLQLLWLSIIKKLGAVRKVFTLNLSLLSSPCKQKEMSNPFDYSFPHKFSSFVFRIRMIVLMKKPTTTMSMNKYQWSGWPYMLPITKDKTAPRSTAIHTSIRITISPFSHDSPGSGGLFVRYIYPCSYYYYPHSSATVLLDLFFIIWIFKLFIRCTFLFSNIH